MNEQVKKERVPRPKSTEPRAYVCTDTAGTEWLVTMKDVRVATAPDLLRALGGDLKTRKLEEAAQ